MRKKVISALVWLLVAAGVASSATILVEKSTAVDNFCQGYAICK